MTRGITLYKYILHVTITKRKPFLSVYEPDLLEVQNVGKLLACGQWDYFKVGSQKLLLFWIIYSGYENRTRQTGRVIRDCVYIVLEFLSVWNVYQRRDVLLFFPLFKHFLSLGGLNFFRPLRKWTSQRAPKTISDRKASGLFLRNEHQFIPWGSAFRLGKIYILSLVRGV